MGMIKTCIKRNLWRVKTAKILCISSRGFVWWKVIHSPKVSVVLAALTVKWQKLLSASRILKQLLSETLYKHYRVQKSNYCILFVFATDSFMLSAWTDPATAARSIYCGWTASCRRQGLTVRSNTKKKWLRWNCFDNIWFWTSKKQSKPLKSIDNLRYDFRKQILIYIFFKLINRSLKIMFLLHLYFQC